MEGKISFRFTRQDLLKLIGASLLMFLGLVIGVEQVGEEFSVIKKDFLQVQENSEHLSAEKKVEKADLLTSLCLEHQVFCQKIVYTWELSDFEKLSYTSQYLEIISFLDQKLLQGKDIKQQFKTLILNAEKGKRRGWATRSRITMNLASLGELSEYWGVLTHEFGHIVDLGLLQGLSKYKDQTFTEFWKTKFSIDDPSLEYYRYSRESEKVRKAESKKSDFCSGYGMTNPFEDFAECHNLFLNNKSLFEKMTAESPVMKKKYNFLANLFDAKVLTDNEQSLLYAQRRPWDTTVI